MKVGIKMDKRNVQYYPGRIYKVIQNKQIFHSKYVCDDVLSRSTYMQENYTKCGEAFKFYFRHYHKQ